MTPPPAAPDDSPVEVDATCLEVVAGLLAGDRAALAAVYQKFVDPLVRRADRLIPARQRAAIVAESVVHSVMESFLDLDTADRDRLARYRIGTWPQLYGLLARVTVRKCLNRIRKHDSRGRSPAGGHAVVQVDDLDGLEPDEVARRLDGGPTAEDDAAFAELLGALWAGFTPFEGEVIRLSMDGHAVQDIADRLDTTTTVVKNARRKLSRWLDRRIRQQDPA